MANTPIIPRPLTVTHNEGENRNASCVYTNNNPINICKNIVTLAMLISTATKKKC